MLCTAEYCNDSGEHIVITEETILGFDFFIAYGVIFIYNRDYTHLEKRIECIDQIFFFLFFFDIICIEQNLGNSLVIVTEELVIQIHQTTLSDSGGSLFHTHTVWFCSHVQFISSYSDRSGGNEYDFISHVLDIRKYTDEAIRCTKITFSGIIGKCGCSYFYYDSIIVKSHNT